MVENDLKSLFSYVLLLFFLCQVFASCFLILLSTFCCCIIITPLTSHRSTFTLPHPLFNIKWHPWVQQLILVTTAVPSQCLLAVFHMKFLTLPFLHGCFHTIRKKNMSARKRRQRNNNAYKGTSNSSWARLSMVSVSSLFLKGHNKAVSQCVSQSGCRPQSVMLSDWDSLL